MNNLDALLRSIAKRADAQGAKTTAPSSDVGSFAMETENPVFEALLRTLSSRAGEGASHGEPQVGARFPILDGGSALQSAGLFGEQRNDLGTDEANPDRYGDAGEAANVDLPRGDVALLAQVVAQPQGGQSFQGMTVAHAGSGTGPSSSLLDMIDLPTEEMKNAQTRQDLGDPSIRKASVLHQETHFKPLAMKVQQSAAKSQAGPTPNLTPGSEAAEVKQDTAAGPEQVETIEDLSVPPQRSREAHLQSTAESGAKNTLDVSQPNAVLQRIADAVASDARRVAPEDNSRIWRPEFPIPTAIKASDGVLRVLDIQLRPAELGLVTVKMRLSGDTLEMELHASRDETAELLRKDSEKLSSLLRTSGYRPDVITIHSGGMDASQQDSGLGQRQSAMSHAGSQFSGSQGGDAEHGRQPGRGAEGFEGDQGGRRSETREISVDGRDTGGLYL